MIAKQHNALQVEFITGVKLICYFVLYYCFLHWAYAPNMAFGDLDFYYTLYLWDVQVDFFFGGVICWVFLCTTCFQNIDQSALYSIVIFNSKLPYNVQGTLIPLDSAQWDYIPNNYLVSLRLTKQLRISILRKDTNTKLWMLIHQNSYQKETVWKLTHAYWEKRRIINSVVTRIGQLPCNIQGISTPLDGAQWTIFITTT